MYSLTHLSIIQCGWYEIAHDNDVTKNHIIDAKESLNARGYWRQHNV